MVEITDITKLRPELVEMPDAEFERRDAEWEMAKAYRAAQKRKAKVGALVDQINAAQQAMVEGAKLLDEYGLLPEEIKQVYTASDGVMKPHLKHKLVDADRMLARIAAMEGETKPKRPRRKKAE